MSYFHPTRAYGLLIFEYFFILRHLLLLCEVMDILKNLNLVQCNILRDDYLQINQKYSI